MAHPQPVDRPSKSGDTTLAREIGLLALAATGICSMLGAAINVIPFMNATIQSGIGSGERIEITSVTATDFFIEVFQGAVSQAAVVDWTAKGY